MDWAAAMGKGPRELRFISRRRRAVTSQAAYGRLVRISFLLALVVSGVGAYVRLSDAGLSCPDWPGCYGALLVPTAADLPAIQSAFPDQSLDRVRAWKEMTHRYAAALLGLLILLLGILAWRRRHKPDQPLAVPMLLVGLVTFQALLGMWTVTLRLQPIVVTMHLLTGIATVALLWWLSLLQDRWWFCEGEQPVRDASSYALRPWALAGVVIVLLQITLGGWTSANYAALACPDFPLCQAEILPPLDLKAAFQLWSNVEGSFEGGVLDNDARVTIHIAHRLGAILTLLYAIVLATRVLCVGRARPLKVAALALLTLVFAQAGLGVANVVLGLPIVVAVAHSIGAFIVLLSALAVYHMTRPPPFTPGCSPEECVVE